MVRIRSRSTIRVPSTSCPRSLSTEQMTTCSMRGSLPKRATAVAMASSASSGTIGQTRMPSAIMARSASRNWASNAGSTSALDLYPAYISLRHDSMTWSVAAPMWVTSGSRRSDSIESTKPCTALTGRPSGASRGWRE